MLERMLKPLTQYRGLPRPIYVLFFSRIVTALGQFVAPMMALILTVKIGYPQSTTGILITVATLGNAVGLAFGGRIADRYGRKRTMVVFSGLSALVFLACAFLQPGLPMVAMLMLAPLAGSLGQPAAEAMIMDLTEPKNRKESFSLIYMGFNLGFAVGPALAGLLFQNHLPWVFAGDALTTLVSLLLIVLFVPEPKLHAEIHGAMEGRDLEKAVEGSVWTVLRARPLLPLFAVILALNQFCYSQWGFLLPLQMTQLFGVDGARNHGLLGSLNGLVVILCTPLLVHWLKNMRPLNAMAIGGTLFALAYFAFGSAEVFPTFLLIMVLVTVGEVVTTILMPVFLANQTPSSHRGRISAFISLVGNAGWSLGYLVMGFVSESIGIPAAWRVTAAIMGVAVIGMLLLRRLEVRNYCRTVVQNSGDLPEG